MKVFRIWKYVEHMSEKNLLHFAIQSLQAGWPIELEDKTPKEIKKLGYCYIEEWLVKEVRRHYGRKLEANRKAVKHV